VKGNIALASLAPGSINAARDAWLGFLDTYRTLCVAPNQEIRSIFDELRSFSSSF